MKFDWEIARLILLNYEYSEIDRTTEENLGSSLVEWGKIDDKLKRVPERVRYYHEALLIQQGLAEGIAHRGNESGYAIARILNLTIPGHELAEFLRSEEFFKAKIWVLRRKYAIEGAQKIICGVLDLVKAAISPGIKIF